MIAAIRVVSAKTISAHPLEARVAGLRRNQGTRILPVVIHFGEMAWLTQSAVMQVLLAREEQVEWARVEEDVKTVDLLVV